MAPPARRRRALRFHATVAILYVAAAATAATETADELFAAALRAQSAGQIDEAVSLLGRSANLGDARAQTAYGLANHHGMGGLARDTAAAWRVGHWVCGLALALRRHIHYNHTNTSADPATPSPTPAG